MKKDTIKLDSSYTCEGLYDQEKLVDVLVNIQSRTIPLLGELGYERELAFLPPLEVLKDALCFHNKSKEQAVLEQNKLVVLIGSGLGFALEKIITQLLVLFGKNLKLAVVDKEISILEITKLKQRFKEFPGIYWLQEPDLEASVKALTLWQQAHNNLPFFPLVNPFYLRLDREYYGNVQKSCEASQQADFWGKVRHKKFVGDKPRILLLTSKYFLMGEIISACQRLGIEHFLLELPDGALGQNEFVEKFLKAVVDFQPDFAMTINHLGVDREGVLTDLLARLELPLASWFVDNPHLVLHLYARLVNPWTAIFTWDSDNLPSLKGMGFEHAWYLPLGVDATRFSPGKQQQSSHIAWKAPISFVGNSMVKKVAKRMGRCDLPNALTDNYKQIAAEFSSSPARSVVDFLQVNYPDLAKLYQSLHTAEDKLGFETMLTWEATLQYRLSCVQSILPYHPLIVGDDGWFSLLPEDGSWRYHSEVNYYEDLPIFYPLSDINFNCTSKQMKGAVNQRVFDVPATESFLLTDYREQVEQLFDIGEEIICYHSPEESSELIQRYLKDEKARKKIAKKARQRVLAEHTYEIRLQQLVSQMKKTFG